LFEWHYLSKKFKNCLAASYNITDFQGASITGNTLTQKKLTSSGINFSAGRCNAMMSIV